MLKINTNLSKANTRIFYIEPQWGDKTYPYYFGTMKEVMETGIEVIVISNKITSIQDLKKIGLQNEDVIIFGYGWLGTELFYEIEGLQDLNNIKICFFHKPFNNLNQKIDFVINSDFSLLLSSTPQTSNFQKLTNIKTVLFPYACDNKIFGLRPNVFKKYDIGFSGALHNAVHYKDIEFAGTNLRFKAQEKISKYYGGKKFLHGSDNIWMRIRSIHSYAKRLQKSKMWLSTSGPMHDMSSRYFEAAGSSAICLTNTIPKEYSKIFKNGENVIVFKEDCSNLIDSIANTIEDVKGLEAMAQHTRNYIMKNHTYIKRAEELLTLITKIKD